MFKKFEILINFSSNQKKKEQCVNNIVDIFERTLNNSASIKSQRKSFEKWSKISKEAWIMWKNLMKQEISNSENDRIQYFYKMQQVAKELKFKLHRQDAILTESRHEHVKFSWTDYYDDDCTIYISDKKRADWFLKRVEQQRQRKKTRYKTLKEQYEKKHSIKNRTSW